MIRLLVLILLAGAAGAQIGGVASVGVMGGVPILDALHSDYQQPLVCTGTCSFGAIYPATKHYTVGVAIEVRLPLRLAIEGDVLYSRINYSSGSIDVAQSTNFQPLVGTASTAASRWEVPLLVKYRFTGRNARPFVLAGPAIAISGALHSGIDFGGFHSTYVQDPDHSLVPGFAWGGGIEWKAGPLHLAPQFRYSHWLRGNLQQTGFGSNLNQAAFLLSLMF